MFCNYITSFSTIFNKYYGTNINQLSLKGKFAK